MTSPGLVEARPSPLPDLAGQVVLVDSDDRPVGTMEKQAAHREGRLHRALSVIVRSSDGRLLMQRRALGKYHSGGIWTNTCCSHPWPGEPVDQAAIRRLNEEMGIRLPALEKLFSTIYRAPVGQGLIEHELVHVYGGVWDGKVDPDPAEVDSFAWCEPAALRADLERTPARYSVWFRTYVAHHWDQMIG